MGEVDPQFLIIWQNEQLLMMLKSHFPHGLASLLCRPRERDRMLLSNSTLVGECQEEKQSASSCNEHVAPQCPL